MFFLMILMGYIYIYKYIYKYFDIFLIKKSFLKDTMYCIVFFSLLGLLILGY